MSEEDASPERPPLLQRGIRESTTRSTAALWSKSLLNALLFFAIFMIALPWGAHRMFPLVVPAPEALRTAIAVPLLVAGVAGWAWGLDVFSRRGRGTPFPLDAPRHLDGRSFTVVLCLVVGLERVLRVHLFRQGELELDGIGAGFGEAANHLDGRLQGPVVVGPDLGNDVGSHR